MKNKSRPIQTEYRFSVNPHLRAYAKHRQLNKLSILAGSPCYRGHVSDFNFLIRCQDDMINEYPNGNEQNKKTLKQIIQEALDD